jgi:hypothetical protein
MKVKVDFITNSSSASFSILKEKLSREQSILIFHHIEVAKGYGDKALRDGFDIGDEWLIYEDKKYIRGDTTMDNFDMRYFLEFIGVKDEDIDYESD